MATIKINQFLLRIRNRNTIYIHAQKEIINLRWGTIKIQNKTKGQNNKLIFGFCN